MYTDITEGRKRNFIYLIICLLISVYLSPILAQDTRDHRPNKKAFASQVFYFDEADAIFGKRTEVKKAYPTFKYTGKVPTIRVTQALKDGVNSIYGLKSGHTLYAIVQKGKIIRFEGANDGSSNTLLFSETDKNKSCFNCTELCFNTADGSVQDCWTICETVDCSKDYNAQKQGQSAPTPKSPPLPVGPIPIPYPNSSKLDSTNRFNPN